MAKKTGIENAEKTLNALTAKAAELAASGKADDAEMADIAFAAYSGDQKAAAKLESIKDRALRRDLESKALASAIAEAKRRVVAAQEAEAMAEAARVAEEVAEIAGIIREQGALADKALRQFIKASNVVREAIAELQNRGVESPSAAQLQALGRRAILGNLVDSPFHRDFEHLAPRERTNFAHFTNAWASALLRHVGKTKQESAA